MPTQGLELATVWRLQLPLLRRYFQERKHILKGNTFRNLLKFVLPKIRGWTKKTLASTIDTTLSPPIMHCCCEREHQSIYVITRKKTAPPPPAFPYYLYDSLYTSQSIGTRKRGGRGGGATNKSEGKKNSQCSTTLVPVS